MTAITTDIIKFSATHFETCMNREKITSSDINELRELREKVRESYDHAMNAIRTAEPADVKAQIEKMTADRTSTLAKLLEKIEGCQKKLGAAAELPARVLGTAAINNHMRAYLSPHEISKGIACRVERSNKNDVFHAQLRALRSISTSQINTYQLALKSPRYRYVSEPGLLELVLGHCLNVTHLDCRFNSIIDQFTLLELLNTHLPALTSIDVSNSSNLLDSVIKTIAKNCRRLTSINLSGCYQLTNAAIETLATNCPGLTSISLQSCGFTSAGIHALAKNCRGLTSINLGYRHFFSDAELNAFRLQYPHIRIGSWETSFETSVA